MFSIQLSVNSALNVMEVKLFGFDLSKEHSETFFLFLQIFLRSLKRLVCLGSDTYYLLNDLETISMRGLDQPKTSLTTSSVTCDRRDQPAAMDMRCSPRLEREVEEVSRQLHLLTARAHLQDSRTEVINEWRLVGLVLDRLLFFVFLLIYLMCAVIVLA